MDQFFVRATNVISRTRAGKPIPGRRLAHTVSIRKRDGTFQPVVGAVFDTGAQHTVVPTRLADKFDIPYSADSNEAVRVTGATGRATGYPGQITMRFPELSGLEFDIPCLFVDGASRLLIGLPDQLPNFDFTTHKKVEAGGAAILGVL